MPEMKTISGVFLSIVMVWAVTMEKEVMRGSKPSIYLSILKIDFFKGLQFMLHPL